MTQAPGAGRVARLVTMTVALAIWSASGATLGMARQDAPTPPVAVGAGPVRERSLALVGRTVYGADAATMFGYLTAAIGLDPALLFTASPPSVQSARLTYVAEVALSSSANRGDVTAFAGDGVLRIYVDDDAGAAWDDPASFASGQLVAEFSLLLRDTMQRQAPGVGVVIGDERLAQLMAGEFTLDGVPYRFGQDGIEMRLRSAGALTGGGEDGPAPDLTVDLTGSVSVIARETVPVSMGGSSP
ncbi:MAG: hypothetical protein H0V00_17890 [Chloroflexia bacterium]|nr:hypothetical protein [Chloroflexia bacterium]